MTEFRHMRSPLRDRLVGATPKKRRSRPRRFKRDKNVARPSRVHRSLVSLLRPLTSWRMPVMPRGAGLAAAFAAVIVANIVVVLTHGSALSSSQDPIAAVLPVEQLASPKPLAQISLLDGTDLNSFFAAPARPAKPQAKSPTKDQTKAQTKANKAPKATLKSGASKPKSNRKTPQAALTPQEPSTSKALQAPMQALLAGSSTKTTSLQKQPVAQALAAATLAQHSKQSSLDQPRLIERKLSSQQTVAAALDDEGLGHLAVHEIVTALSGLFDFRQSRPGDGIRLTLTPSGQVQRFEYKSQNGGPAGSRFIVERDAQGLVGHREEIPVTVETAVVSGRIASSLYASMIETGESPSLISTFTNVFGWEIDFYREVQQNDRFRMIVEKRFADGKFIGYGRLLAGEYAGHIGTYRAFYYKDNDIEGYFNDTGESMEKTFLRAPVQVVRITSTFGRRHHPILGYTRRHNGVDYGVPRGTPIWSVANGRVIQKHYERGYGNVVKLRHPNGYETVYAHMSKFADIKVGQKVHQRQVIGYCGSTGLSTGPHVHFGMKKAGHYVNPLKQKFPRGKSLPKTSKAGFEKMLKNLAHRLDSVEIALADLPSRGQG